jgi:hypothetical protein
MWKPRNSLLWNRQIKLLLGALIGENFPTHPVFPLQAFHITATLPLKARTIVRNTHHSSHRLFLDKQAV